MPMFRLRFLVALVFLILAGPARGEDDARAIVEKAIKAHGGADKLAKLQRIRINMEGAMIVNQDPVPTVMPFAGEDTWSFPEKSKRVIWIGYKGSATVYVQVLAGDKGWIHVLGKTTALAKEQLAELQEQNYEHQLDHLLVLREKQYQLTCLDEIKIDGRRATGVKVTSKGHRDVKLYFDKQTGLLAKREHLTLNLLDAADKEVLQEDFFLDYKEFAGVKHWGKMITHHGGKKSAEAVVTEIKFLDKVPEKEFEKP